MFFPRAYVSAPSCTPSRSAILAGQHFWRLGAAGVLWGEFGNDTLSYQRILAAAGYHTGYTGKGWGPGLASGGDPVGQGYNSQTLTERPSIHISATDYAGNFAEFLDERPDDTPFSFWVSPFEPHRPYEGRAGSLAGIRLDTIRVPDFLPDTVAVRQDLANYYLEINWLDQVLGQVVAELEQRNLLENTIIVVTSDNGMPFPRAKANNYDYGARVPLAIRWGAEVQPGQISSAMVNLSDLAPTFLAAANLPIPIEMTGRNLLPLLTRGSDVGPTPKFDFTVTGFERHIVNARPMGIAYPSRAIHTPAYSLIRNYAPARWPAGNPPEFRDIDGTSPSRDAVLRISEYAELATAPRPEFELYDRLADPYQLNNLALSEQHITILQDLNASLENELRSTDDPLMTEGITAFDSMPSYNSTNQ